MSVDKLGPLDWRIPIVTPEGRPTQEFQRRWATQENNNGQIGSITLGSGPPPVLPAPADGAQYADTSTTPYTLYIASGGSWGLAGSSSANPTAVAKDTPVNGTANTFMRSDAAPAVQKGSASQFGILKTDGATIQETGGVISARTGSSTQKGVLQVDGTTITETGGIISAAGGGGGGSAWTLLSTTVISTPTASIDFDIRGYDEIQVIASNVTSSANGYRVFWASVNNGASYLMANSNYRAVPDNGVYTNSDGWVRVGSGAVMTVRTILGVLTNVRMNGVPKLAQANGGGTILFTGSLLPVTHLRLANSSGGSSPTITGNLTGGTVYVFGR